MQAEDTFCADLLSQPQLGQKTRHSASSSSIALLPIPENEVCESWDTGCIAWVAILRNEVLLLDIGEEHVPHTVMETAGGLLELDPVLGWDTLSLPSASWKGLRFHVYDDTLAACEDDDVTIWTFCCVHNSNTLSETTAQRFVLEHMVVLTDSFRATDSTWRMGGTHSCQFLFAPMLQQRMEQQAAECKTNTTHCADVPPCLSQEIIERNRVIVEAQIRKYEEKEAAAAAALQAMDEEDQQSNAEEHLPSIEETEATSDRGEGEAHIVKGMRQGIDTYKSEDEEDSTVDDMAYLEAAAFNSVWKMVHMQDHGSVGEVGKQQAGDDNIEPDEDEETAALQAMDEEDQHPDVDEQQPDTEETETTSDCGEGEACVVAKGRRRGSRRYESGDKEDSTGDEMAYLEAAALNSVWKIVLSEDHGYFGRVGREQRNKEVSADHTEAESEVVATRNMQKTAPKSSLDGILIEPNSGNEQKIESSALASSLDRGNPNAENDKNSASPPNTLENKDEENSDEGSPVVSFLENQVDATHCDLWDTSPRRELPMSSDAKDTPQFHPSTLSEPLKGDLFDHSPTGVADFDEGTRRESRATLDVKAADRIQLPGDLHGVPIEYEPPPGATALQEGAGRVSSEPSDVSDRAHFERSQEFTPYEPSKKHLFDNSPTGVIDLYEDALPIKLPLDVSLAKTTNEARHFENDETDESYDGIKCFWFTLFASKKPALAV